jgi:hypothetical protein
MAPLLFIPALALLLCPGPARADGARRQADDAAVLSGGAATAADEAAAREAAARPFDGGTEGDTTVVAPGVTRRAAPLAKPGPASLQAKVEPPAGVEKKSDGSKLSTGLMMGGAAVLGGLQGWFAAGLVGAAAGAGLGLAAAWLFHKKDYGGAFGVTAGAIIGTAFGGPIGGLIGAVVGGILGHFLGKLFL